MRSFVLIFFVFFAFSLKAHTQSLINLLGPKKYYVTSSNGNTYTENITRTLAQLSNQYRYKLSIKNADGAAHPLKNCSGLSFFQKLICDAQNAITQVYVNQFRVTSAVITLNNTPLTTLQTFTKDTLTLEFQLTLQQSNQLKFVIKGNSLAYIDVRLESTYNAVSDTSPPTILSSINSNTSTNLSNFHISVTDPADTITSVYKENILLQTFTQKEFDLALTEGLNNFSIRSIDQYNNTSPPLNLNNIRLDTIPAQINTQLASEYIYSTYPQSFTFSFTTDEDVTNLYVNNVLATFVAPRTYSYMMQINSPQTLSLNLIAYDLVNNQTQQTYTVHFGLDNIAPVISTNLQSNSITNSEHLEVHIVDNTTTTTEVYSNNILILSTPLQNFTVALTEGNNSFVIKSKDQYGNEAQNLQLYNLVYDSHPALLTSLASSIHYTNSLPTTLHFSFSSNEPLQTFTVDGETIAPISQIYSFSKSIAQAGNSQIALVATDLAGNSASTNFNFNLILDSTAPTINTGPYPAYTSNSSFLLPITVEDSTPVTTEVHINQNLIAQTSDYSFTQLIEMPSDGDYLISIRTTDSAGNVDTKNISVTRSSVPLALQIQAPQSGNIYDSQNIIVRFSANRNLAHAYVNDVEVPISADGKSVNYLMQNWNDGLFTVTVKVEDIMGNILNRSVNAVIKLGGASSWSYEECPVTE